MRSKDSHARDEPWLRSRRVGAGEGTSSEAVGLVETAGHVALVVVADCMAKAARVRVTRLERTGAGLGALIVRGTLGAVTVAVEAGVSAARARNALVASCVLPNADRSLEDERTELI